MDKHLKHVPHAQNVWSSNPRLAKFHTGCKRFATASTTMQVAVLSWHYVMEK